MRHLRLIKQIVLISIDGVERKNGHKHIIEKPLEQQDNSSENSNTKPHYQLHTVSDPIQQSQWQPANSTGTETIHLLVFASY